jgi:hypothetical protein
VDGREWCEAAGDVLKLNIAVATFHTGIYRPRLDVLYMWPKDHESVLMRERPLGLTIHGYVHQGAVSQFRKLKLLSECMLKVDDLKCLLRLY